MRRWTFDAVIASCVRQERMMREAWVSELRRGGELYIRYLEFPTEEGWRAVEASRAMADQIRRLLEITIDENVVCIRLARRALPWWQR